ncbi:MAG: hypothetical protein IKA76_03340 [Clostridia bacterium]|nr:hypothetical protein [Clostridia bacterium]
MTEKRFDLRMNRWGPYNKEYLGVCHIADPKLGATFNVELFPGFFRRKVLVSHAVSDNGLKMWGANPELTRFSYRYELEWKDRVYCDADFVITDDCRCDITCTFVNRTELPQSVNLNVCASMQYPTRKKGREVIGYTVPFEAFLPEDCTLVDCVDYDEILCKETLASDGRFLGEFPTEGASGNGTAIHGRYFSTEEHFVRYTVPAFSDMILIRYKAEKDCELSVTVKEETHRVRLFSAKEFETVSVPITVEKGDALILSPLGESITLDCLVFGQHADETVFRQIPCHVEAKRTVDDGRMTLSYKGISHTYTLEWKEPAQMVRRYYYTDIGRALPLCIHDHVSPVLRSQDGLFVYENILSDPLFLEPGESKSLHFTVRSGDGVQAKEAPSLYSVKRNPAGETYAFSQNMMAYNTFLNVVYPIYTRRQYIRHNTPGRNWDSLYSWDSGFIGMGLASADFNRAYDCLYTYLTPVGDPHSPYIFHGSVVPTQIFLYQYLYFKYPEQREKLRELYPMVKQFFRFYSQMDRREDQMRSGLLKTWNIFYNSGGWDDYPPQDYLYRATKFGMEGPTTRDTSPVITTALTVLIAKILRNLASDMGFDDREEYELAICKYSKAILSYAWNEDTGYFSYVVHDEKGQPKEFLKYKDGSDYNQGFDGIYPYIAGITDGHQSERIVGNILNGLMTPIGVGVVDTRASYYNPGGYWNGSVWMPHQWILWRALLDHGEGALAFRIADTALKVWKRETDETYCCFEHFMSANGRGSGFHQFSGLSTPVLLFFESYYTPGSVTTGFEPTILSQQWNENKTELSLACSSEGRDSVAVVCMNAEREYSFTLNGSAVNARRLTDGAYEIPLSCGKNQLNVMPIE